MKNNIRNSIITITGHFTGDNNDQILRYFNLNYDILKEFKLIILALNFSEDLDFETLDNLKLAFNNRYKNIHYLFVPVNRGVAFGHVDLLVSAFNHAKYNVEYEWHFFASSDVVINDKLLNVIINNDSEFLYLPNIGFASVEDDGIEKSLELYDNNEIIANINFFGIHKNIQYLFFDHLLDYEEMYRTCYLEYELNSSLDWYELSRNTSKVAKYIGTERLLDASISKQTNKKQILISKDRFKELIQVTLDLSIHDPSMKNILFTECGICHLDEPDKIIIEL